jgi:hypothetical protein
MQQAEIEGSALITGLKASSRTLTCILDLNKVAVQVKPSQSPGLAICKRSQRLSRRRLWFRFRLWLWDDCTSLTVIVRTNVQLNLAHERILEVVSCFEPRSRYATFRTRKYTVPASDCACSRAWVETARA